MKIIIIDGDSGLLVTQVIDVFGFSSFELRHAIYFLSLDLKRIDGENLDFLKSEGVVDKNAKQATFLDFEAIYKIIYAIGDEKQKQIFDPDGNCHSVKESEILPVSPIKGRSNWNHFNEKLQSIESELQDLHQLVESLTRQDSKAIASAATHQGVQHKALSVFGPGETGSLQGHSGDF
ncbi:MAG: hypothetical protein EOP04_04245 [Proteobacteria bacterium]|nr:MAG: hypothetical protein EOP04_04245 [Pseudomonadota bacterium]